MSAEEKAVEETAKTVRHYLDPVLQNPLAEIGLLLRDKVSFWRFKNQVKTAMKAKDFLDAHGIDPRRVGLKAAPEVVVPLLEAAGDAEDETISSMFSSLLAGALDPDTSQLVHPSFAKVLGQLAPLDAHIVDRLYKEVRHIDASVKAGAKAPDGLLEGVPLHRQLGYDAAALADTMKVSVDVIALSFDNLKRLGLCDEGQDFVARANKAARVCLTDYGTSLMLRCTDHAG